MDWTPNKIAFDQVCQELESGRQLTLSDIGRVFGQPFWEMIMYCFLDAHEAARAIQNAMARLSGRNDVQEKE